MPNLLRQPKVFNEKVLYCKFVYGDYHQIYGRLSDKYSVHSVRDYIAEKIGNEYLIPLVHESIDPASLNSLPCWKGTVIKPKHAPIWWRSCWKSRYAAQTADY